MKWKILLLIFVVALAGIFLGNISIVNKIDLNLIHFIQNSPILNKRVGVISDINPPLSPSNLPSQPKKITVQEKNPQLLNSYLNELNFWGKSAVRLRNGNQTWVTAKKLNIHLTGEKYLFNNFTETDLGYLRSTSESFSNGTLDLFIGMNPNYYFNEKYDVKKAEQAFESQVFLALFALTKPDKYIALKELSTATLPKEIMNISNSAIKNPIFELETN